MVFLSFKENADMNDFLQTIFKNPTMSKSRLKDAAVL